MRPFFLLLAILISGNSALAQTFTDNSGDALSAADRERILASVASFIGASYDRPATFTLRAIRQADISTQGYCGEILIDGSNEWAQLYVNFDAAVVRVVPDSDTSEIADNHRVYLKAFGCI